MALSEIFNRLRRIADGDRANKTFNQGQSKARQQAIAGQINGVDSQTGLFTVLTPQGTTVQLGQQRGIVDGTIAGITKSELSGRAVIPAEGSTTTTPGATAPPIIGVTGITVDASASPLLAITGATALTISLNTQAANKIFAGPATGADAAPTFRSLVNGDIPTGISPSKVGNSVAQWNAAQLQGRDISTTAPTDLQVLTWDGVLAIWKPADPTGGGGATNPYRPTITSLTPSTAAIGGTVTIAGTKITDPAIAYFANGVRSAVTVADETSASVTVPSGAVTGDLYLYCLNGFASFALTIPAGFIGFVEATNPLIWYYLSATSGDSEADHGSLGTTGAYTGSYTLGESTLVPNYSGSSVLFANGKLRSAANTGISGNPAFSLGVWVNLATLMTTAGFQEIIAFGNGVVALESVSIGVDTSGNVYADYGGGSACKSTIQITANTSYYIEIQKSAGSTVSTTRITINGVDGGLASSSGGTNSPILANTPLVVAQYNHPDSIAQYPANGYFQHALLWNTARTAADALALYEAGTL